MTANENLHVALAMALKKPTTCQNAELIDAVYDLVARVDQADRERRPPALFDVEPAVAS